MPIDPGEVTRIAKLARVRIEASEAAGLAHDLERIVAHIDSLRQAELADDAESLTYFGEDVTRADETAAGLDAETALRNAPADDGTFFLVPKIVDKDDA